MARIILIGVILTILVSCTKEVPITPINLEPVLVLNSLFSGDSIIKVYISNRCDINMEKPSYIQNAQVLIYEDGLLKEELKWENSFYQSEFKASLGKNYTIFAEATGFPKIESSTHIPLQPIILSTGIDTNKFITVSNPFGVVAYNPLNILIEDDVNIKNYYELFLIRKTIIEDTANTNGIVCEYSFEDIISNSEIINAEKLNDYYLNSIVFSDSLFNGTSFNLELLVNIPKKQNYIFDESIKFIIVLRSITKDYYRYKKSLIIKNQEGQFGFQYFSNKYLPIVSNIKNGYGIFSGYNMCTDTITIF